ncbi:hypothetical protein ACN47E_007196 [Coniothyrium glycines]
MCNIVHIERIATCPRSWLTGSVAFSSRKTSQSTMVQYGAYVKTITSWNETAWKKSMLVYSARRESRLNSIGYALLH